MPDKEKKRILILVPGSEAKGGINNYFNVLRNEFGNHIEYFLRGNRTWPIRSSFFSENLRLVKDYFRFLFVLINGDFQIVQCNTSLHSLSLIRDAFFIVIAKLLRKKVIVFFRGWHKKDEERVQKYFLSFFKIIYFSADTHIVLANEFKNKLIHWGYLKPIYVETTLVDKNLISGINKKSITQNYENKDKLNLLFLARIEKGKGIYELLEAYHKLKNEGLNIQLNIAGDGLELKNVSKFITKNKIKDVKLLGFLKGQDKIKSYTSAHIYVLPSYTEGMPNSVLEAMAFGLPVITTPVGGIVDFFDEKNMGALVQPKKSEELKNKINSLVKQNSKLITLALNNYSYAQCNFLSSVVATRLENIYNNL